MPQAIDVNRGLARDNQGNMLWETRDVLVETQHGPFTLRELVGQPHGGVVHRQGPGGVAVFMYNDDPGIFLNERGSPVSEQFAAAAGFDVQTLAKARRKKLAMARAQAGVNAEFESLEENSNIIIERGEYRLVEIAAGFFQIHFIEEDGHGSPLSAAMPRKAADKLFEELAPPLAVPPE